MPKQVKIKNGDLEGVVAESSLSTWERHGWTRADDGSSEEAPKAAPTKKAAAKSTSKEG